MGSTRAQLIGRHRQSVTAVLVCVAAATLGSLNGIGQDRPASAPQLDETPLKEYKAFRRMHAVNEKFNHEAWLEARTELNESGFRYEIVSERGSETIRNKVLRTMLVREQELIAQGQGPRAELTCDNYVFEESTSGNGVRYVVLKPKRKDMLLVDGRMVLNQTGTELLRVEGRLAKNPSFWTSLVNVTREFASVDGVRVPVTTETFAKLKFAGSARMKVSYEYESINGRPVSMAARQTLAAAIGR
jgi:hypothetical protein